jgi:hypothetical protein
LKLINVGAENRAALVLATTQFSEFIGLYKGGKDPERNDGKNGRSYHHLHYAVTLLAALECTEVCWFMPRMTDGKCAGVAHVITGPYWGESPIWGEFNHH